MDQMIIAYHDHPVAFCVLACPVIVTCCAVVILIVVSILGSE
jgi:hypothetical protein